MVLLQKNQKKEQSVIRIITISNSYDIIVGLEGYIKQKNKKDSLIQFDIGELCYIPNDSFETIGIKQKNDIIKLQKGKEMKDKVQLLKSELEVTNQIMLECDLVGVLVKDNIGQRVNVIKNRVNGVSGLIPGSMWDSLVIDYFEMQEKADKIGAEEAQKVSDKAEEEALDEIMEVFNDFLNELSEKPEVKKATSKINEVFEGVAKSLDEIRPEILVKDVQKSFGERGNLKSFLESIEKTVNEVYGTAQEKAETVKETVKTKAEEVAVSGISTVQRAKLKREKAQLDLMIDNARNLNVSTKGFEKKVQKKIDLILQMLG
jgi:hypothetical protein